MIQVRRSDERGHANHRWSIRKSARLHLFQIWIEPATTGTEPSYQIRFNPKENRLKRLARPVAGNGAARINQDAPVFVAELAKGRRDST